MLSSWYYCIPTPTYTTDDAVITFRIRCDFQNGCPSGEACGAYSESYNCIEESDTNANNDPQALRHLVLLILLSCSMFIVRREDFTECKRYL